MPKKITNDLVEPIGPEQSLTSLIENNKILVEEVRKLTKKLNWFLWASQLKTIFWLLVIVVSIIASVIYLPPLIKNFLLPYENLLASPTSGFNLVLPKQK